MHANADAIPSPSRAEAFAGRLAAMFNDAAVTLMISIGHRTGLFDSMSVVGDVTSRQLAEAADLNERYVREWLGAMLTGGIVEHDPHRGTYRLPAEHAASLTRAASPANLAVTSQFIPMLGSVEDRIVDCFRNGGGVPDAADGRYHEVMAEESAQTVLSALVEHMLPLVPGAVARLEDGIDVIDVGCGSGRAIMLMAERFPRSRFTGADFSTEAITRAADESKRRGLRNVRFVQEDAARMTAAAAYDLVTTFDAVHDQADPAAVLANIRRALRPGGAYLMQDIGASSHHHENVDHPMGPFLYTISCLHCMTVSLSADGAGLGAMWGDQVARAMLAEAGFGDVTMSRLPHDPMNYYYVARP
jgi:SAM-dependent methyltransferase